MEIQEHSWDLKMGNSDFISWKKNLTSSDTLMQPDRWVDEECDLSAHPTSEKFAIQSDTICCNMLISMQFCHKY